MGWVVRLPPGAEVTRQAALHWITVSADGVARHEKPFYLAIFASPPETEHGCRGPGPRHPFRVSLGQRQSTAIAALTSVRMPIDQKIAGGTEPLLRWRPAPMPRSAPMMIRIASFVPIFA